MSSSGGGGGGGSTTRHVIEVLYQVTGLDKAGTGMTSFNTNLTKGQQTLDKFGTSATKASTEATKLGTSIKSADAPIAKTSQTVTKLDSSMDKTGKTTKGLTDFFRGNKGLIFSTTMLTSGGIEAIGMYQGWTDASEKLAAAHKVVNDLEARGLEGTKEHSDAVRELSDAQRGYNFITRFTIQSFADLIPMSLMFTSSMLDLTAKLKEGTGIKAKFAAAGTKLVTVFQAMTAASLQFIKTPLGIAIAAVTALFAAFATNAFGFRDRVNEIGVALGNAVPQLQGALTWIGNLSTGFLDSAAAAMGMGTKTTEALVDVEKQVLTTGDATVLSIDEQIKLYNKLGDEAKDVSFSIAAHWKMQQEEIKAHEAKYEAFVEAIQTGNEDMLQSTGMTGDEFKEFYKEWQKDIQDFESDFTSFVDVIVENYKKFGESARESQEEQGEELDKLQAKLEEHQKKKEEIQDKDSKSRKEALEKWEEDNDAILADIERVSEGMSEMAVSARQDWYEFSKSGEEAMKLFKLETVSGNFSQAIETITTAMDEVPEKYKGNMQQANSILDNEMLSAEARADIFVAHYDKLDPFKSFIVGAHEYTKAQAEVTSGLDELAVAARANVTDMGQMDDAWKQFVGSLSPAQRDLPIVQSAIEGVDKGAIDAATAFGMVEAAGVTMSEQLGTTVTRSFEDLKKTLIDLPGPMTAVFANIGGQIVKVGEVTDQSLISGPKSATASMKGTQTQAATLATTIENEMSNSGTSVDTFATNATTSFDSVVKSLQGLGTELGKLPETLKNAMNTESITKAWDGFRNALGETGDWVNKGVTSIAGYLKSAITIDSFKEAWTGFWSAVSEGADVITSGISVLAKTIATDIKLKALSGKWWQGFWDALKETGTWVGTGITAIGKAIISTIKTEGPKWWVGFQEALGASVTWVKAQIGKIGSEIISNIKTMAPKWWVGFQQALGDATEWVKTQLDKIAKAITGYDWAKVGSDIWAKISGAFGAVKEGAGGIWDQILKFFGGGMQEASADTGKEGGGMSFAPFIDTKLFESALAKLKTLTTQATTEISAMFTTMESSIKLTFQRIGALFPTAFTQLTPTAQMATSQTSAAFVTMEASIKGTLTRITSLFPTAFTQLQPAANLATSQTSATFITMMTSIQGTITQIQNLFPTAFAQLLPAATQATSQTSAQFITMLSSIQGTITQIGMVLTQFTTTDLVNMSTGALTHTSQTSAHFVTMYSSIQGTITQIIGQITKLQQTFSTLSTSVATYAKSMEGNIGRFATSAQKSFDTVASSAKKAQSQLSNMSTSVATYMSSMTSKVNSFASACQSAFNKVGSSADAATKKVKALQSAINALKDKTVTITVNAKGAGLKYVRHGGSFVNFEGPAYAASGAAWIQETPKKIGGTHVAETFPELITAIPLDPSEKNSPFHNVAMDYPMPSPQTLMKTSGLGGGGGSTTVSGDLYVTVQLPNGQAIASVVKPYLLEGYSGISSS